MKSFIEIVYTADIALIGSLCNIIKRNASGHRKVAKKSRSSWIETCHCQNKTEKVSIYIVSD